MLIFDRFFGAYGRVVSATAQLLIWISLQISVLDRFSPTAKYAGLAVLAMQAAYLGFCARAARDQGRIFENTARWVLVEAEPSSEHEHRELIMLTMMNLSRRWGCSVECIARSDGKFLVFPAGEPPGLFDDLAEGVPPGN